MRDAHIPGAHPKTLSPVFLLLKVWMFLIFVEENCKQKNSFSPILYQRLLAIYKYLVPRISNLLHTPVHVATNGTYH